VRACAWLVKRGTRPARDRTDLRRRTITIVSTTVSAQQAAPATAARRDPRRSRSPITRRHAPMQARRAPPPARQGQESPRAARNRPRGKLTISAITAAHPRWPPPTGSAARACHTLDGHVCPSLGRRLGLAPPSPRGGDFTVFTPRGLMPLQPGFRETVCARHREKGPDPTWTTRGEAAQSSFAGTFLMLGGVLKP